MSPPLVEGGRDQPSKPRRLLPPCAAEASATVVIVALGAYLRLVDLEYAQFMYDDVTLWNIVRSFAIAPQALTRGMHSSFGIENGPFQVYLLLPGLLTAPSPIGAYYVVAAWNVLAVVLLWAFVRRYWGMKVALLAALFYSVNPWAIIFSRRLWGNDLLAPLNVLLVWSLCDLNRFGRRRDSVLPLLWLSISVQVYVVAFVHAALATFGVALGIRRLRWPYAVSGLALAAALAKPYLVDTVLPSLRSLVSLLGMTDRQPVIDTTSMYFMFHIVSSEGYQAFANHVGLRIDAASGLPYAVSLLTEALLALGLTTAGMAALRGLRSRDAASAIPYMLPAATILLPAVLLVRHTAQVQPYYLLTGFPMHFLFVALGVRQVWRAQSRVLAASRNCAIRSATYLLPAALALVVGVHLLLNREFLGAIREYAPTTEYGLPMRYTLDLAENTRRLVKQLGLSKVYLGGAAVRDSNLYLAMRSDLPAISPFGSEDAFIEPDPAAGRVLYILSSTDDRVGRAFRESFADREVFSYNVPGPSLRYSFYSIAPAELANLFHDSSSAPLAATFDGRARLDSFSVDPELLPGLPQALTTHWTILRGQSPDQPTYYRYVKLVDGSGKASHGVEVPFYAVGQWQEGEHVIAWDAVPTPADLGPGAYSYLLGLFHLTDSSYQNATVRDPEGADIGSVRLGMMAVRSREGVTPTQRLAVPLGRQVVLEGYDQVDVDPGPGGELNIDLYWKALTRLERGYSVFVHLLGRDGKVAAQHDGAPGSGRYPTLAWLPGDTIVDRHSLPLPPNLVPGQYTVEVGLYDVPTGDRLGGQAAAATFPLRIGERASNEAAGER